MRSNRNRAVRSNVVGSAGALRAVMLLIAVCAALMLGARTAMAEPPKNAATDAAHATAEHAGGHGEHEKADVIPTVSQGIVPGIVSLVIFTAVFGILAAMVWPKILKASTTASRRSAARSSRPRPPVARPRTRSRNISRAFPRPAPRLRK